MNAALSQLVHHPWFWRGDDLAFVASTLPTGYEALDRELPGGGWPRGQLIELLADDQGIGELRLLLPALRVLVGAGGLVAFARHSFDGNTRRSSALNRKIVHPPLRRERRPPPSVDHPAWQ